MFNDNGMSMAMGGFGAARAGAGQQAGMLAGMINQAQNAWGNELDSRVAQNREMRRLEHEKELERMRQDLALKKIAADQQKMQMEYEAMMTQMKMQDYAKRGDTSKTLVNGRWVPSWMM